LAEPRVQKWLEERVKSAAKPAEAAADASISSYWNARLTAVREHIAALLITLPDLPVNSSELPAWFPWISGRTAERLLQGSAAAWSGLRQRPSMIAYTR